MHNQSSQIDELFRDASQQVEQMPVEGNWDDFKQKLYKRKAKRFKYIFWGLGLVVFTSFIVFAVLNYFNNNTENTTSAKNIAIESKSTIQPNTNKNTSVAENINNTETRDIKPNENKEVNNISSNINPVCYKVQLGAYKNKPDESIFKSIGNVVAENKDGYYKYYAGVYNNPNDANKRLNQIKALGFDNAFISNDHEKVNDNISNNLDYSNDENNNASAVNTANNNTSGANYQKPDKKSENQNSNTMNIQNNNLNADNKNISDENNHKAAQSITNTATTTNNEQKNNVNSNTSSNSNNTTEVNQQSITTDKSGFNGQATKTENKIQNPTSRNNSSSQNLADSAKAKDNVRDLKKESSQKNNVALNKWGVGFSFSCDMDKYRMISNNDNGTALLDSADAVLKGSGNFAFTTGLQVTYRFSEKLSVEAGMLYSQKRRLSVIDYNYRNSVEYSFDYNGRYIDIPVRSRYYFISSPVNIFATAGIVFNSNFPVKSKGYFMLQNPQDSGYYERVTIQPSSVGISMQIGAGAEYMLNKKIRFYFLPMYNYSFSPVLKHPTYNNEPIKHFINSFNITAGCYFDF
ncbi:MAG TPA: hypothetical protein PKK00_14645 [Bacteroidales bacterium]|nr:hypothetical protein [Bacteroidales bacterium]HPS18451.1 hypothetical protein [Bacteroidales bacterium]